MNLKVFLHSGLDFIRKHINKVQEVPVSPVVPDAPGVTCEE
jgi:hypothetical protein